MNRKIRFVQKVVIRHPQDKSKFLILVRSKNDTSRPGDFDLAGGSVSLDELHVDALTREVMEETSLEIDDIKPIIVRSDVNEKSNIYWLYIGYVATAKSSDVKISENEHSAYEWLTLDEFIEKAGDHMLLQQIKIAMNDAHSLI